VETAFQIRRERIVGAPAWFDSQLFEIRAKGNWGAERPTADQVRALYRQVLEQRFAFAAHREERVSEAVILRVVRSDGRLGPGLRRSAQTCDKARRTPAGLPALRPD
jgi:uncharacterized protein (TIGR03435 family)